MSIKLKLHQVKADKIVTITSRWPMGRNERDSYLT
jgi:hypothetical protein